MIAESTHWYDQKGLPAYTIVGKNGKERNVNLRDARELNLVPSVTTILGVAAKPQLENWKITESIRCAIELTPFSNETLDQFIQRAKRESKQKSIEASEKGTKIHAQIECGFSEKIESEPYLAVKKILDELYPDYDWVAEDSFSHPKGFGGKIDLYSPKGVVVDFKTKDNLKDKDPARLVYDEYGMQLSAYAYGLNMDNPERVSIFIDREDNTAVYHKWDDSHDKHLEMFLSLLTYWQLSKGYKPEVLND